MSNKIENDIKIDEYDEESFWRKCAKYAKAIGEELLKKALTLYYSLESPSCTLADTNSNSSYNILPPFCMPIYYIILI